MMVPGGPQVILASGSAARRSLLAAAGVAFEVRVPVVDESAIKRAMWDQGGEPATTALALADAKARSVQHPGAVVVGADQLLVCGARWFDKPSDLAEARRHLLLLRGRSHTLLTAATAWRDGEPVWRSVARPSLTMRAFSETFLDRYLAVEGESVLGCVGGYRLEGLGVQLFSAVSGEHAAILGLPMIDLLEFLRTAGVLLR